MVEGFLSGQLDKIFVCGFTESTDLAVDKWAHSLTTYIDSVSVDARFYVLMDVSAKNVSFTPRARQCTLELFDRYRNRQGRFAFLFSSRVAPYYSRIFFASLGRLSFDLNYFTDKKIALEWLQS